MTSHSFHIAKPVFEVATAKAHFMYKLGELEFTETLVFHKDGSSGFETHPAFEKLLDLTACVLGVSYFKLRAPFSITAPEIALGEKDFNFIRDVYENGLAEFYARNDLKRFGKLSFDTAADTKDYPPRELPRRSLLPIGGGKDSLVSVQLLENTKEPYTPFAVNPKGPILTSVDKIDKAPVFVERTLDPEMIRLSKQPGYFNGHVPSTAINSMIAALAAILMGFDQIILSNERSASEGNMAFDGREANHQHSKSLEFEKLISGIMAAATGGSLKYFSLLRPYSEAKIAKLFARENRFDSVFSSCNRNFRLSGHDGALWCGECPKCLFTFLIMAPQMPKHRLETIFGRNLLADPKNEAGYRELTGLAGQKPWECVGEILEAAACLWVLTTHPDWQDAHLVRALNADLKTQYGVNTLTSAWTDLQIDSDRHLIPAELAKKVALNAT